MFPAKQYSLRHRLILLPVLTALALLTFAALMLPAEPVWITDNGNKLMIMHNFLQHDTIFFTHPSPENFPCGGFHFQHLADGRISSFHSPCLPVLTAFCRRIAGRMGTLAIPVISLALLASVMTGFPGKKRRLFTALAAAPLIYYSLLLWEMIPAALAVTLAAWLIFRRKSILAGAIFGAGNWMREELLLLGAVLAVVLLINRQWRMIFRFAAGAAVPVILFFCTNYALFGHPLGLHGSTYFVNNRPEMSVALKIREVLFNFYQHLVRFDTLSKPSGVIAALSLLTAAAAGTAKNYCQWGKAKLAAGTIFVLAALAFAFGLWQEKQYLLISAQTFGLFISVPVLAGLLLNWRALLADTHRSVKQAAWTVTGYTLLLPFLLNPHDIGLTWGARHFIMVLPLMIFLSVYAAGKAGFFRMKYGKILAIAAAAAGIIMQIYALNALVKVTNDTESLQNEILSLSEETVISDLFFLPEMTPQIPFAKTQLEVSNERQLTSAMAYLEKENIRSFILILSPDYRRISNQELSRLLQTYPPAMRPVQRSVGNSLKFLLTVCRKKAEYRP